MAEDWKLQVSVKSPSGDLINVRAGSAEELSVLLEGLADYSTQIASTSKAVAAAYAVLPLSTGASTPNTAPSQSYAPTQPAPASDMAGGMSTPTCIHGARIFRQGVSKTTGKPYAFWACPTPQGTPDQCKPAN